MSTAKPGRKKVFPVPPPHSKLRVLAECEDRPRHFRCVCRACLKSIVVRRDNIVSGRIVSCGCYRRTLLFPVLAT